MDPNLRNRIIEDLDNSGFASEMHVIRTLTKRHWRCSAGAGYFDKDEGKFREVDIIASIWDHSPGDESVSCHLHIVGEVKKSDKPWVVFRNERPDNALDAWSNLYYCNWPKLLNAEVAQSLIQDSLLTRLKWQGYGIHESFKKPEQPSRWYAACISACKASEHVLERETTTSRFFEAEDDRIRYPVSFDLVLPVVILDGLLISASLSDNGEVQLEEVDAAPMVISYRSTNYSAVDFFGEPTEKDYRIDIARLAALEKYLELCEVRLKRLFDAITSIVKR